MTEPDVTLTDFFLGLQGLVMAAILARRYRFSNATAAWLVFFVAAGLAALSGGLVHGFFLDPNSAGRAVFWPLSLTAIGVNALAAFAIGAQLVMSPASARRQIFWAKWLLVAYCGYVWLFDGRFVAAIAVAAPTTLFLLATLLVASVRDGRPGALVAAGGVSLTLAAVAVQYFEIALDPVGFNHNATAHVVQAASLALVFVGCLRMLKSTAPVATETTTCFHDAIS